MLKAKILILLTLFTIGTAFGRTQTVLFGGSKGSVYVPSTFTIAPGDTVVWEGTFYTHPLESKSIPAGASPWNVATGTTFKYVPRTTGKYAYICTLHDAAGMVGSFTVASLSTRESAPNKGPATFTFTTSWYSNERKGMVLRFAGTAPHNSYAALYDLSGDMVVAAPLTQSPADQSIAVFKIKQPARGLYAIRIFGPGNRSTGRVMVR